MSIVALALLLAAVFMIDGAVQLAMAFELCLSMGGSGWIWMF